MNRRIFCSIVALIFFLQVNVLAQFINLQINIEPELSATVEQELSFGSLIPNSGRTQIELGDLSVGVFNIRAHYTQSIYLHLDSPPFLRHINPAIDDTIPIELIASYNNTGENNPRKSVSLTDNFALVPININQGQSRTRATDIWQELYVYIYGAIDVGDVSTGLYEAIITLTVQYD